ncbi:uncharacterized protein LOC131432124 [Malaya genurostris]|uniref:uncharacterized protein LOC131432124 n=1 Tax=Malaya genurostris TaxID=325434 RepID=UPI0026F3A2CC|nr:uncharacterized protein LOC131432124 [Malaya genurostris]
MTVSHLIEKLKVGKRFVLLDLVVQPDCELPWDSAGPENKFLTREDWKLIYRELDSICQNHFGGSTAGASSKYLLDKEYQLRLTNKLNILIKYEFKCKNQRDNLNFIFHVCDRKLHSHCLYVQIVDDVKEIFRELKDKNETIERQQKEIEKLRNLPDLSQEYTPAPIKTSLDSSSEHLEYIPFAINGNSTPTKTKYKASRIEDTVKVEPDPYTPTYSQEIDIGLHSYVPATFSSPNLQTTDQKVASSPSKSSFKGKRSRSRHAQIFGGSDEEEDNEPSSSSLVKHDSDLNRSVENIFSEDSPPKVIDLIGSSSGETRKSDDGKRAQLPRKTKTNAIVHMEETCQMIRAPNFSLSKRRRKDSEIVGGSSKSAKKSASALDKSGTMDQWLIKEGKRNSGSSKDGELSSSSGFKQPHKNKENGGHKTSKKAKKEKVGVTVVQPVDHEKLRAEEDAMRKTCAGLDKLVEMLPEDKSELDVPILDCTKMSNEQMLATFAEYRGELRQIFDRYKDKTERQWQHAPELVYYTEVTGVLGEDQTYEMMKRLEEEFVPAEDRGKYTEFFSSILVMEWGIRIWMKRFNFTDRRQALDRIRLQEEANPVELTSSYLASLTGSSKKRR